MGRVASLVAPQLGGRLLRRGRVRYALSVPGQSRGAAHAPRIWRRLPDLHGPDRTPDTLALLSLRQLRRFAGRGPKPSRAGEARLGRKRAETATQDFQ